MVVVLETGMGRREQVEEGTHYLRESPLELSGDGEFTHGDSFIAENFE